MNKPQQEMTQFYPTLTIWALNACMYKGMGTPYPEDNSVEIQTKGHIVRFVPTMDGQKLCVFIRKGYRIVYTREIKVY